MSGSDSYVSLTIAGGQREGARSVRTDAHDAGEEGRRRGLPPRQPEVLTDWSGDAMR